MVGTTLDLVVIVAYFAGIVTFGVFFGRFTKSTHDFFLAGQRFPAWLVTISCIATVVGSYSFVKYSTAGYNYGLSSSQTYLNDWFWMPLWMFGWLPILYYGRVLSVPEYFERRFDRPTRLAATGVLLLYLVGYIGINFFTFAVFLNALFGWDILASAMLVAALCMVYEAAGGQTSVIMTDLLQGCLLLVAGLTLFILGVTHLGGLDGFWSALPAGHRSALPGFNTPDKFNFVGIFWQDGMVGGVAFYFMHQGMIMRFLSTRSVSEGRRAAAVTLLVLMPLAAISVSGAGWIGAGLLETGEIGAETPPDGIFVHVAHLLAMPGVFGLIMAAMAAALMSTTDTLINATSAILINDVYRPLHRSRAARKGRIAAPDPDRERVRELRVARLASLLAASVGVALVPIFAAQDSIYQAHGAFTAAVTPPMAVALILGAFWRRFTPAAALATLTGGTALMFLSLAVPALVTPFAHGTPGDYTFIRAFFGVVVSGGIAVGVSLITRPRPDAEVVGLTWETLRAARDRFKRGRATDDGGGPKLRMVIRTLEEPADPAATPEGPDTSRADDSPAAPGGGPDLPDVALSEEALRRLKASPGDILFIDDSRWWMGGLRSVRGRAAERDPVGDGESVVWVPRAEVVRNRWSEGKRVIVQRVL